MPFGLRSPTRTFFLQGRRSCGPHFRRWRERHDEHIKIYGDQKRHFACANEKEFSWGIGDRFKSVRISNETKWNGGGYLEDRRPAAGLNYYTIAAKMVDTICGTD